MTDFSLQPLPGLVDFTGPTVHHVAELSVSDLLAITTSPERWAYAISFDLGRRRGPLPTALGASRRPRVEGRVLIRLTGWVSAGRVGIGLVGRDGRTYLQEVLRTPGDGLTHVDLWIESLAACEALVVRNAADGPSTITLESIRAYRWIGDRPVAARWIEHRQQIVRVPGGEGPAPAEPGPGGPAVTILLAVKNGMPYLVEAIESLRRQRYRNFEVIAQDGGSDDGTLEYLRGVRDLALTVRSERDTGIGEARSRAHARCRTDLVGSIDADNVLKPDALSTAVAVFQAHPEAAAVYGAVELIEADGRTQSCFVPPEFDLLKVIACELVPPWSTAFFSRRVCGPHLFFDPAIAGCGDYDTWLRLGHLPVLQVREVLGSTRLHGRSVSCRIENYDVFCEEKIRSLRRYLERLEPGPLGTGLLRHGITGIYCWAAESLRRLGASQAEVERYVDLALATDPTSERASRLFRGPGTERLTGPSA